MCATKLLISKATARSPPRNQKLQIAHEQNGSRTKVREPFWLDLKLETIPQANLQGTRQAGLGRDFPKSSGARNVVHSGQVRMVEPVIGLSTELQRILLIDREILDQSEVIVL